MGVNITDKFFTLQNTVQNKEHFSGEETFLSLLEALSRTIYQGLYVIDYYEKSFDYVSDKPMFFVDILQMKL